MEILNKDELFLIAIQLDFKSLINFCISDKRIYQKIYENDSVWFAKLNYYFPNYKDVEWKIDFGYFREIYRLIYFLKIRCGEESSIRELYEVKELNLSYRYLSYIPKEIENLTNLETFHLYHNSLIKTPKEICNLTNLYVLNLNFNKLKSIKEICNLINLKNLYLSYNSLEEVPEEIGNLSNLQKLSLTHNKLKELPKEIGNLSNLQDIYLFDNRLKELPNEMTKLINLQYINLDTDVFIPLEISENHKIKIN